MKGDKLIIHEGHLRAAKQICKIVFQEIMKSKNKFIITIAGESGSGKSEIAESLSQLLSEKNIKSFIFQQDDYFIYPPKTNAEMRRKNINNVGLSEVNLALLDQHLKSILQKKDEIDKPLVIFDEDRISDEIINLNDIQVIMVEGTYTTTLQNVNKHIFIDQTYIDTRESREKRAREEQDEFLEKILKIEHKIISSHKSKADIIITRNYEVTY
ncbi:MAG: hypothetical protein KAW92_05315 [Candidatus Cloacimonetes bacterium]|nr:hypothetical protein [Candidatus Cloacimonadota bacterium]MCK4358153.1 hypothetical protein [Candidatus Cloacimonadota bacterium]